MFLVKFFKSRNFDENYGFYKPNNFGANLLEYFMDKALLDVISKCKESRLALTQAKEKELKNRITI